MRFAAIAAVVVASLSGLVLIDRSLSDATSERLAERRAAVETVADSLGRVVDSTVQQLDLMAAAIGPLTTDPDPAGLETAEALVSSPGPLGGTLVVIDPDGIVRVAPPDSAALLGQQLVGPTIDRALDGTVAASGILRSPDDRIFVYLAVPVLDAEGGPSGALVSRIDPTRGPIAELLTDVEAGSSSRLALVTDSGAVVAADGAVGSVSGNDPNTNPPLEAQTTGIVPAYRGEADVVMTAVYAPVREDWQLVAFEPRDAFRSPLRRPFWVAAIVLGTVASVAIGGLALGELRARRAEHRAESAKRSLLAVAGHELRTPLTVVRGLGQTLVGRWEHLPERSRLEMIRTIERQGRVLDHLVERLLYAAQLESDATAMVTPRQTDVGRTVRRAAEDHAALAPAHEIELDVEEPLTAYADAKALDQVLFHLLDNAVRYSPSGGTITVTAKQVRRQVEIVVQDEGVGLPADIDAIFGRFVQGETVTTRTVDEGGVGLGLHIVRTLAELMDGSVRAENRQPRGARFVVTLPADIA